MSLPAESAPVTCSTLVLGGARSGKSALAERLAHATGLRRLYVATAEPLDDEMRERIARHAADRAGDGWRTVEEPLDLAGVIGRESRQDAVLLVDCLTLWLSNVMLAGRDLAEMQESLLDAISGAEGPILLVSNEVGFGIVPESLLGRDFRDAQGRLNQRVAAIVPRVLFVAAGLSLALKAP